MFQRMISGCVKVVQRYLPEPFIFAIILTFIAALLAMPICHQTPIEVVEHWGGGVWNLLAFSMQMALVLVCGSTLAAAPVVKKAISALASLPKSPAGAIALVTAVSAIACWLNWGFGLIVGVIFAKEIARKLAGVDYRLLIASAYSGFVVWHAGLSGSIPLTMATPGEALTAGNVGGSVHLDIKGGTMLGSIYGGGRLGSVGYGLYAPGNANYGVMREDGKDDAGNATDYYTKDTGTGLNKNGRGNIVINISGSPVIGNTHEYVYWSDSDTPDQSYIPNTPFDASTSFTEKQAEDEDGPITKTASTNYHRLYHTKGGNVFGGSMGRLYKLDNTTPISNWDKLAHAKSTTITVSGTPFIRSSIYGGSELGQVEGNTSVTVSGGTIGSEIKKTFGEAPNTTDITQYTFGCLYGGG